jgi:hypothetical protein
MSLLDEILAKTDKSELDQKVKQLCDAIQEEEKQKK